MPLKTTESAARRDERGTWEERGARKRRARRDRKIIGKRIVSTYSRYAKGISSAAKADAFSIKREIDR